MRHLEAQSYTVIGNKAPCVNGNCRVEPVKIKSGEVMQHAFTITHIENRVGHQRLDWGKNDKLKDRRKEARENNRDKHRGHH
jgi:hypothetical protein